MLLQRLWQCKIGWDDEVPRLVLKEWHQLVDNLSALENLRVEQHVLVSKPTSIVLHCFCDASQLAYGACVYLTSTNATQILSRLVTSKSRVAPLKVISLPRLELCAAALAAELYSQVRKALNFSVGTVYFWSDSTIVLAWLSSEPNRFKTFIANRVSRIQSLTRGGSWKYVPTAMNQEDIISRGLNPEQLMDSNLWWDGRRFLRQSEEFWPTLVIGSTESLPDTKPKKVICYKTITYTNLIDKHFSFSRLLRVVAYVYRFINNAQGQFVGASRDLSITKLEHSKAIVCKIVQAEYFQAEAAALRAGKAVTKTSRLASLDPFLNNVGLIRVGGRLRNSSLSYQHKHPIILPSNCQLVTLIIRHTHYQSLHAGTQAILSAIRTEFWPLSGKRTVRSVLRKCIVCFKAKPSDLSQKMVDLPIPRVTMSRPFTNCGVDYAGPYQIKDSKYRNKRYIKAYVCVFSCLATRAMHIELVSDLTASGFLNALKKFVSRRGLCSHVYSENATNFVGANNKLRKVARLSNEPGVREYLLNTRIRWHFILPRSPHFGGSWESVIRQTKYHLTRVLRDVVLSFEEFYTLLTQVESIINSRPLTPLTEEPDSLEVLTPGHIRSVSSSESIQALAVAGATILE